MRKDIGIYVRCDVMKKLFFKFSNGCAQQATLERWRMVWYTAAVVLALTNCLNFLMVSSKEQVWNRPVAVPVYPKRQSSYLATRRTRLSPPPRPGPSAVRGNKNPAYVFTEEL